tara:strand:+ start:858 stop:1109 length:252 start_codon:yes stop_codon:yes gene_type:complete
LIYLRSFEHTSALISNKVNKTIFCAIFTKESLALRISRSMFNERKSIESFHAYQCIRNYLFDLSMQELIKLAKEYGIEVVEKR